MTIIKLCLSGVLGRQPSPLASVNATCSGPKSGRTRSVSPSWSATASTTGTPLDSRCSVPNLPVLPAMVRWTSASNSCHVSSMVHARRPDMWYVPSSQGCCSKSDTAAATSLRSHQWKVCSSKGGRVPPWPASIHRRNIASQSLPRSGGSTSCRCTTISFSFAFVFSWPSTSRTNRDWARGAASASMPMRSWTTWASLRSRSRCSSSVSALKASGKAARTGAWPKRSSAHAPVVARKLTPSSAALAKIACESGCRGWVKTHRALMAGATDADSSRLPADGLVGNARTSPPKNGHNFTFFN